MNYILMTSFLPLFSHLFNVFIYHIPPPPPLAILNNFFYFCSFTQMKSNFYFVTLAVLAGRSEKRGGNELFCFLLHISDVTDVKKLASKLPPSVVTFDHLLRALSCCFFMFLLK